MSVTMVHWQVMLLTVIGYSRTLLRIKIDLKMQNTVQAKLLPDLQLDPVNM